MKRPSLVFGLVIFTLALLFLFMGGSTLFVAIPIAMAVLIFYLSTKKENIKKLLIIPVVSITILISSVSLTLNNHFVFNKSIQYADTTNDIVATVIDVTPKYYILKTKLINSNEENIKILFVTNEETSYKIYDNIFIDNAEITESRYDTDKSEKCIVSVYQSIYSEKIGEKEKDLYYNILNLKFICFDKLSEYLYNDSLGVASGMLFGGTDYISSETKTSFRSSGVAHLLAVSGLHTSLWCGLILNLLKLFKIKERYANIFGIFVLIVLSVVSGFTPSVIRASFMMGLTLVAPVFKKHSDSINSLGLSAGIIILINPYVLYSPSFYLSFLATLGVVLSSKYSYILNPILNRLQTPKIMKNAINFVYSSILISLFSTLFTLPASVYYFGVISIISPLTNLLSVNLAFCTMIATLVSLIVSFIPFNVFSYIAEFLFTITDLLLKLLITITKVTGNFEFSCITANKEFVYIGLSLSVILFTIYFIAIKKFTLKSFARRLFASSIIAPTIIALILSVIPFIYNTEFVVLGNTNTPNIIIRSGTHYLVINPPTNLYYDDYEHFPKSNNDSLDLLAITNRSSLNTKELEYIYGEFNVKKTLITPYINTIINTLDMNPLNKAEVSGNFNYSLKNQINIRIFDTYGKNCAIIEVNGKFIVLSFSEYNDLVEIKNELGKIDVLILPQNVPDNFGIKVDTLIICSTLDNTAHKNDILGLKNSVNFYRNATSDDIEIKL